MSLRHMSGPLAGRAGIAWAWHTPMSWRERVAFVVKYACGVAEGQGMPAPVALLFFAICGDWDTFRMVAAKLWRRAR